MNLHGAQVIRLATTRAVRLDGTGAQGHQRRISGSELASRRDEPDRTAPAYTGLMALSHLLYLHGFRSSPRSTKARLVGRWVAANRPDLHWWCPQLPPSPKEAAAMLEQGLGGWPTERSAVIGSSLGGFYATVLAERLGWQAVVLNPAIHPERDLARHIGEHPTWQSPQDRIDFRAEYIDELRTLKPERLTRLERYAAVIATGDEVLDWHEMKTRYAGAAIHLIQGGDHALTDFGSGLAFLIDQLQLIPPAGSRPAAPMS
jgi:predicted esterase YcpF (UPF0227 family)